MRIKESFSCNELSRPSFWSDLLSEAIVSCYLVMYVTFALVTLNSSIYQVNITHIGLLSGFVIYLLIEGYGPISGGHMNPSVSFCHLIAGRITMVRAFFYTVAQCGGGVLGSEIVYLLAPPDIQVQYKPFTPANGLTAWQGMVIEMLLTFNLLYVGLASSEPKTHHKIYLSSLPTAFCVGTGVFAGGTWTGGVMNPIVALGPAVISRNFEHHWVYWVSAYLAAILAAGIHKVFLISRDKPLPEEHINKEKMIEDVKLSDQFSGTSKGAVFVVNGDDTRL